MSSVERALLCLVPALLLAGCDRESSPPKAPEASTVRPAIDVDVLRSVSGRWESAVTPLPGMDRRWLVLDLAADGRFTLDMRTKGPRTDVVLASASGRYTVRDDWLSGSFDGPEPRLAGFNPWRASKPEGGVMRVTIADGRGFDVVFRGL